jgi:hypothetical protein
MLQPLPKTKRLHGAVAPSPGSLDIEPRVGQSPSLWDSLAGKQHKPLMHQQLRTAPLLLALRMCFV